MKPHLAARLKKNSLKDGKSWSPRCSCVIERQTEMERKILGSGCFPLLFHLTCALLSQGREMKKYISHSLFYGAVTQYGEGWKLHHVSVRLLHRQSDIHSFTIQTLSSPYYCLPSTFSFIFPLVSVPLLSSRLPSSLPFCHFVYIWKADRAFGSHSNRIKSVWVCVRARAPVLVHVTLKSRGWFAALPLQL